MIEVEILDWVLGLLLKNWVASYSIPAAALPAPRRCRGAWLRHEHNLPDANGRSPPHPGDDLGDALVTDPERASGTGPARR